MADFSKIKEQLETNGYAVVKDLFSEAEIEGLKGAMAQIVDGMDPGDHPKSAFTTTDENQHIKDEYFLNSSDKIRFFYETGALNDQGQLIVPKDRALNKVGHALHWLNPQFRQLTFSEKMKNLIRSIHYKEPAVVQSMYIFKQPSIGGEVTGHQDATFLYVEPIEHLVGVWIAVDDATLENGCLWFLPGSHKIFGVSAEKVTYRFVRTNDKSKLLTFTGDKSSVDDSKYVAAPVTKGSVVLIHGLVWHKSAQNTSTKSRHAYTFHVVERQNTQWSSQNWLQETEEYKFPKLYAN